MKNSRIDRRSFIVLGSSAVVGLAAFPLGAQTFDGQPQLFVGFSAPPVRSRGANRRAAASVFAADSVSHTEPSFARTGARFSFRGLQRKDNTPLRLHVDVMHQVDGIEAKVPYLAWTYDSSARATKSSSPVAFNVPVDGIAPLEMTFAFSRGGAEVRRTIPFTVANAAGAIPLNPGSYIFAIADRTPDWSELAVDGEKLTRGLDTAPAGFDYLILRVSTPAV